MAAITTEIKVFPANSRKASLVISSLIPKNAIDKLSERLGIEAGQQAEKALRAMNRTNGDLMQFRVDDTRIRIAQVA